MLVYKDKRGNPPRKYEYKSQEAINRKHVALKENFTIFSLKGMISNLKTLDTSILGPSFKSGVIDSLETKILLIKSMQRERKAEREFQLLANPPVKIDKRTKAYRDSIKGNTK